MANDLDERFAKEDRERVEWLAEYRKARRREHLRFLFYQRYANTLKGKIDLVTCEFRNGIKWATRYWRQCVADFIAGD